jgi:hypothetical protein
MDAFHGLFGAGFAAGTSRKDAGLADFFTYGGDLLVDLRLVFGDELLLRGHIGQRTLKLQVIGIGLPGGSSRDKDRRRSKGADGKREEG